MVRSKITCYMSELIGTFLLVFIGCGSAVFAGAQIGWLGVSVAFGLTLMVLAYILGNISGCHLNPAVTLSLVLAKRFPYKESVPYIICQFIGAILAGAVLYFLGSGAPNVHVQAGLALTGFGEHSPTGCNMMTCFLAEMISTSILVLTVLLATSKSTASGFAGIAIGSVLLVLHLVNIPITNASLNLARSVGVAVFYGGWAVQQLWLFCAAHLVAVLGVKLIVELWFSDEKLGENI